MCHTCNYTWGESPPPQNTSAVVGNSNQRLFRLDLHLFSRYVPDMIFQNPHTPRLSLSLPLPTPRPPPPSPSYRIHVCTYVCVCVCIYMNVNYGDGGSIPSSAALAIYICMYVCVCIQQCMCMYTSAHLYIYIHRFFRVDESFRAVHARAWHALARSTHDLFGTKRGQKLTSLKPGRENTFLCRTHSIQNIFYREHNWPPWSRPQMDFVHSESSLKEKESRKASIRRKHPDFSFKVPRCP